MSDPLHREYCRRVLTGCTALLSLALLTMSCLPAGLPRQVPPVAGEPDPVPPPQPGPGDQPAPNQPAPTPAPLPDLPADEPSRLVVNGSRSCQMIALTYDAGSGADGAAAILDTLKAHGVRSTFFLTGKWVEKYPDLARRVADEGHEIANHTYSHPDLTTLPDSEVIRQIQDGEAAIRRVTGQETRPLFREPYGAFNEAERRLVRQAGYSYSIYWDVDTLDWQFPGVETLVSRITGRAKNGSIVLMHLNVPDTAVASDRAIPELRSQGYQLVTVSELLACD